LEKSGNRRSGRGEGNLVNFGLLIYDLRLLIKAKNNMADILLTNDDGYSSPGFYPLLKELLKNYLVVAVAPTSEQSWIGKSISKKSELSLAKIKLSEFEIYTIDGTPADCVQIGLYDVLEDRPRLVVSGINLGLNTGHGRILSSGTIGASMEASIDGVKSISSSIHVPENFKNKKIEEAVFIDAAKITSKIISILINEELPNEVDLISINIPFGAKIDTDFEITKPHREAYGKLFHREGEKFKHNSPPINFSNAGPGTDIKALADGKISVTPINLDLVSEKSNEFLNELFRCKW
jgi:5'-nucleotidase